MSASVLAIGLPRTGKTTFLAAFWDVVGSGDVAGSLRLVRTAGDMQYLNEIHTAWANCTEITRTGPASDKPVLMSLEDSSVPNRSVDLAWTDMLGESFERQWTERGWTAGFQRLVDGATGALLFVHPARVISAPLIIDAQIAARQIKKRSATTPAKKGAAAAEDKFAPYDPLKVATQVQLIDLLQFVDIRRATGDRLRLSLVISAWDRVERVGAIEPVAWVAKSMPLLNQFLDANDDRLDLRVFGVSAQGLDYADAKAVAKGRRTAHRASSRIKVVGGGATNDITAPVRWAMGSIGF